MCCNWLVLLWVCLFSTIHNSSTRLPEKTCHWQQARVMLQKWSWHLRCRKTPFWAPPVLAFKKWSVLKTATSPHPDWDIECALCGQRQAYEPFFQMAWEGSGEDTWGCLRPAEVNEVLSLHFHRLSVACSLSGPRGSADSTQSTWNAGQDAGTLPWGHKRLFHCLPLAHLEPQIKLRFFQKLHGNHRKHLCTSAGLPCRTWL